MDIEWSFNNDNLITTIETANLAKVDNISELANTLNQLGITVAQLEQNMKLINNIIGFSFMNNQLRPVAEEKTEIPKQKKRLEIFDPIEWDEDFLKLSEDNEFLN